VAAFNKVGPLMVVVVVTAEADHLLAIVVADQILTINNKNNQADLVWATLKKISNLIEMYKNVFLLAPQDALLPFNKDFIGKEEFTPQEWKKMENYKNDHSLICFNKEMHVPVYYKYSMAHLMKSL
jgi:hypothetical protein